MPLRAQDDESLVFAGAAKVDVTPTEPVVLAGYGGREAPFEGIDQPLWARALVLGEEKPAAIVILDNCGVPEPIKNRLAERLRSHGIERDRLVVAVTHTHNAPNLEGYAPILWAGRTTKEDDQAIAAYTEFAIRQMEAAIVKALDKRRPLLLEWAQGRATFGGNRRVLRDGKWTGFGFQRNGPVDHSLPVLTGKNAEGHVRFVWANYACHCTTVGSRNHVGGDWAGVANEQMERAFPGAVALMSIGCGADVGPQPTGTLALAESHGKHIAKEVSRLLNAEMKRLLQTPNITSGRVQLPLAKPKPRAHWEAQLETDGFSKQLAQSMLKTIDENGALPSAVDYPLSVWRFGDDLAMVFLAGEVGVDYAVRLNRELDWSRLWFTAWANDMPGYIPSRRVLEEGGYEPEFSQTYYNLPGPYDPKLEDLLVDSIKTLVGDSYAARPDQKPAPFHQLPSGK